LLCALLVWTGVPALGKTAAGARGADCRMACCKPSPHPSPSSATCRMGCGRPQLPAFAGSPPSLLPAPPGLPAPSGAPLATCLPGPATAQPPLDLPERPPRA
jgi:hypothetical protein